MNTEEVEKLLEKYYEGETSLDEEKSLREFFSTGDVPAHLAEHQPLFRFFSSEAELSLAEGKQEESLIRRIGRYTAEASLDHPHPGKKRLYYFSGIAAGMLLLLSLVFLIRSELKHRPAGIQGNMNPELAYMQTRQAILMVSVGLNTGVDAAQRLNALDKAVKQIQLVNKFFDYKNQFMNQDVMLNPSTNN
jgi:hypothetical protein